MCALCPGDGEHGVVEKCVRIPQGIISSGAERLAQQSLEVRNLVRIPHKESRKNPLRNLVRIPSGALRTDRLALPSCCALLLRNQSVPPHS